MKAYLCRLCGDFQYYTLAERCFKCGADNKEFLMIDNFLKISPDKNIENNLKKR